MGHTSRYSVCSIHGSMSSIISCSPLHFRLTSFSFSSTSSLNLMSSSSSYLMSFAFSASSSPWSVNLISFNFASTSPYKGTFFRRINSMYWTSRNVNLSYTSPLEKKQELNSHAGDKNWHFHQICRTLLPPENMCSYRFARSRVNKAILWQNHCFWVLTHEGY